MHKSHIVHSECTWQELQELMAAHGRSLIDVQNHKTLEGLLTDKFRGEHRLEVKLLIQALKDHVAQDLLASPMPAAVLLPQLSKRLQNNLGITSALANWVVETWALALGKIPEPFTPARTPVALAQRKRLPYVLAVLAVLAAGLGYAYFNRSDRAGAETEYQRGMTRLNGDDLTGAEAHFNKAIALDRTYVKGYFGRAQIEASLKNLDQALADYNRAIQLDSQFAAAFINRGNVKATQHNLEGAIADYSRAIDINPNLVAAFDNRGHAKKAQGDLDGAIADYKKAIQLNPGDAPVYSALGTTLQAKYNRDKSDLRLPYDAHVYLGLGKWHNGDVDGAIDEYQQAIKLNPHLSAAYGFQGNALKAKCDKGNNAHNCANAYNDWGLAAQYENRLNDALNNFTTAIDHEPSNKILYVNRGSVRQSTGDLEGAMADYLAAIAIDPQYADAYKQLSLAENANNDPWGAQADAETAHNIDPQRY